MQVAELTAEGLRNQYFSREMVVVGFELRLAPLLHVAGIHFTLKEPHVTGPLFQLVPLVRTKLVGGMGLNLMQPAGHATEFEAGHRLVHAGAAEESAKVHAADSI